MKSYQWWLKQKRRVQKKYELFCGKYYSPKEVKELIRELEKGRRERKKHVGKDT